MYMLHVYVTACTGVVYVWDTYTITLKAYLTLSVLRTLESYNFYKVVDVM